MSLATAAVPADPRHHPDPLHHPRVAALRAPVVQHAHPADDIVGQHATARHDLAAAQAHADDLAVRVVLGEAKASDETKAHAALMAARQRIADLETRERATRAAADRLRAVAGPAEDRAHDQARETFHAAYAAKVAELDAALDHASGVSEELWAIHAAAVDRWGFNTTPRTDRPGIHPSVGGLMAMHWQDLAILGQGQHESTGSGARNFSRLEVWREDARERGWIK